MQRVKFMRLSRTGRRKGKVKMELNLKKSLETYKLHINVVGMVALASMAYVYPFDSSFRFTIGCALLATMLLYFRQLPVIPTMIFSGVAIFVMRSGVHFFLGYQSWETVLLNNLPAVLYYIVLGFLWHVLDIRGSVGNMPLVILKLSVADIVSNVAEVAVRTDLVDENYEMVAIGVVAVGVIRGILSFGGYYSLKKYQDFVLAGEQMARYTELTLMIAKLRTELFYLQKSSQDIELVMEQSYWLYNELNTGQDRTADEERDFGRRALAIARSIHEIKKDYSRVSTGIENVLKPSAVERGMTLTEIMYIIEQNTLRFLAAANKAIDIHFAGQGDLVTNKHYDIVSILDNLIMNAIEACGEAGSLQVSYEIGEGQVVFSVTDNGCGISKDEYFVIFKPGYSTKFSPRTGKMSTGLGLAHVKDLVEQLGGVIKVASEPGRTRFTVHTPADSLTA